MLNGIFLRIAFLASLLTSLLLFAVDIRATDAPDHRKLSETIPPSSIDHQDGSKMNWPGRFTMSDECKDNLFNFAILGTLCATAFVFKSRKNVLMWGVFGMVIGIVVGYLWCLGRFIFEVL
ncbi:hypothetical protein [Pasteuria penetrans]|uniref:hypothetical protein n=1 Tax=Pasteuria penetrans TaxID=86005 RepID=UPI000FBF0B45|nr:hypothetical protein [Pasteuria penetrans]